MFLIRAEKSIKTVESKQPAFELGAKKKEGLDRWSIV
jgi:hypothetical protein